MCFRCATYCCMLSSHTMLQGATSLSIRFLDLNAMNVFLIKYSCLSSCSSSPRALNVGHSLLFAQQLSFLSSWHYCPLAPAEKRQVTWSIHSFVDINTVERGCRWRINWTLHFRAQATAQMCNEITTHNADEIQRHLNGMFTIPIPAQTRIQTLYCKLKTSKVVDAPSIPQPQQGKMSHFTGLTSWWYGSNASTCNLFPCQILIGGHHQSIYSDHVCAPWRQPSASCFPACTPTPSILHFRRHCLIASAWNTVTINHHLCPQLLLTNLWFALFSRIKKQRKDCHEVHPVGLPKVVSPIIYHNTGNKPLFTQQDPTHRLSNSSPK